MCNSFGCKSVDEVCMLFPNNPYHVSLTTSTYCADVSNQPNIHSIAYSESPFVEWESELFNGIVLKSPTRKAKCLMCGRGRKLVFLGIRGFSELCEMYDHVTSLIRL
jgi:TATA-box binding protein (TBP) (component of TFIID and TFIIIB)